MKKALIALFLQLIPVGLFAADIPNVVVVSIDALHPAALAKDVSPNLWQIMYEGQFTLDGKSVTPPQTLLNHSAMLTGVPPEKGGRIDNNWKPWQPQTLPLMPAHRRSRSCRMEPSPPLLLEMELPPITSIHSDRGPRTLPRSPVDDIKGAPPVMSLLKFNRRGTCSPPAG